MARIGSTESNGITGTPFTEQPINDDVTGSTIDPREIDAAASETIRGGDSNSGTGESIQYNKDGSIRQKRGRKPGGGTKTATATKALPLDVSAIQFSLTGIHQLLAVALKAKEFELSEIEAKVLAENVANVGRHYDLVASQKSIDWFNLCMALSTIYGTRIIAISARKTHEKKGGGGIRQTQTSAPIQQPYPQTITPRKPTDQERDSLLNEFPLAGPMHS